MNLKIDGDGVIQGLIDAFHFFLQLRIKLLQEIIKKWLKSLSVCKHFKRIKPNLLGTMGSKRLASKSILQKPI
jgi:hypothetical protein